MEIKQFYLTFKDLQILPTVSAESTPLLSWSYTPSLFNLQYNRKTAGHRVYYNLQVLWASIQILEAVLYKQQGRSDKPRPCNYELFIVFLLQMLIVNLVSGY